MPSSEELEEFYGTRYLDDYTAGMPEERFEREMPLRHAAKLALVRRTAGVGSLLDAGCGEGMFLKLAAQDGYAAIGCDYGLRSSYPENVKVERGNLDELNGLPFPDNEFDVVTNWAVLEHLRRPDQAAREMYRVLRGGGYLFCDTPLCDDACERNVAARSHWISPPEHLNVFSARGLHLLLENAGFQVVLHLPSYERSAFRYLARRMRNLAVGMLLGGAIHLFAPAKWKRMRQSRTTQIGDIQLVAARKPG